MSLFSKTMSFLLELKKLLATFCSRVWTALNEIVELQLTLNTDKPIAPPFDFSFFEKFTEKSMFKLAIWEKVRRTEDEQAKLCLKIHEIFYSSNYKPTHGFLVVLIPPPR